jgi:hypothetical protein
MPGCHRTAVAHWRTLRKKARTSSTSSLGSSRAAKSAPEAHSTPADLLAYLGTLRQPAVTVPAWQLLGPFPADAAAVGPENKLDLQASYPGKDGGRVSWRRLTADREGRIDLEAALGTRQASAYLYAPVQSKAEQAGRLVLLLPSGTKVAGWLNGGEIKFQLEAGKDPRQPVPASADLHLRPGQNDLLLRVGGSGQSAWNAVATLVSPQGVELP